MKLYIIVDAENDNYVINVGANFEVGNWEDVLDGKTLWRLTSIEGVNTYYVPVDTWKIKEVDIPQDEIPEDLWFSNYKYCYTTEQGFYVHPNWEPPKPPLDYQLDRLQSIVDYISVMSGIEIPEL